jgi:hypothetical protein
MQTVTFGKKGLANGDMARKREAFIQAERARSAAENGTSGGNGGSAPGLTAAAGQAPVRVVTEKSMLVAYVLWFFACAISAHRFYLGAFRSAAAQAGMWITGWLTIWAGATTKGSSLPFFGLALMGVAGIWMLVDVFLIPGLHRKATQPRQDFAATFA